MTKILRIFAVIAAIRQTFNAHAQLEPVLISDGMDFECDEEWTITECKDELAHEIWFQNYYEKVQDWKEELFLGLRH